MAIVQLKTCIAEGELAQAVLDFEQQIGDSSRDLFTQIDAIQDIASNLALIVQGQNILDKQIQPITSNELTKQAGLPEPEPEDPILADEERLEAFGIYLIKGVVWLAGTNQNIENFRKLFFALGGDIELFLTTINSKDSYIVVQSYLKTQKLPLRSRWTLSLAREYLNTETIESVYLAGDGYYYAIIPTFLEKNVSKESLLKKYNLKKEQISTQVFWLKEVKVDNHTVTTLKKLGLDDNQRLAALSEQRLIESRPSVYENLSTLVSIKLGETIKQCNLFSSRYTKLDASAKEIFRKEILKSVKEVQSLIFQLEDLVRFYGTLLENPNEITIFLEKNTKADLVYLFTKRRKIKGINFSATGKEIRAKISQIYGTQSGNTSTSSLLANNLPSNKADLDPFIDSTNIKLVATYCAEYLLTKLKTFTFEDLNTATGCLTRALLEDTSGLTTATPIIGYPSYDSPAQVINRSVDLFLTLDTSKVTDGIESLISKYTDIFKPVLEAIAKLMREVQRASYLIIDRLRQECDELTRKLQAFMSEYMGMYGTVTLESSLLKCSVGYSLGANIGVEQAVDASLNELFSVVSSMSTQIQKVLDQIQKVTADFADKFLCLPINFLNGLISSSTSELPGLCQVYKVKLPTEVENLLIDIRDTYLLQAEGYQAVSRDTIRLGVTAAIMPIRLTSFKENLVCQNQVSSNLFGAISSNLNTELNPIKATTNTITNVIKGL